MTKAERIIAASYCSELKTPGNHCEFCPYGYGYIDDHGDNSFQWCNWDKIDEDAIDLLSILVGPKRVQELKESVKERIDNVSRFRN